MSESNEKQALQPEQVDNYASELHVINKQIEGLQDRKFVIENTLKAELNTRSSETNWATHMVGKEYEVIRTLKNFIEPNELRSAIGEWIEPSELNNLILPERDEIVTKPARVKLMEVNKLKKQGGMVAELIEKVTHKESGAIRVKMKGVSDDIITK